MSTNPPDRVVLFGVSGHLGQEVVARLDALRWPKTEVVGVVSEGSEAVDFDYRGEAIDALTSPPRLRSGDLVLICTPRPFALEIVKSALEAEVPCIDCSGVLAGQSEVPMPVGRAELAAAEGARGPLLAMPSATTLAWAPILEALNQAVGVSRVVATVLRSASALGRRGLVALSDESIALFNQSPVPDAGPAGQGVAFDVIPDAAAESRTAEELERLFGAELRVDIQCTQVPTFVGEGASLAIELSRPIEAEAFAKAIAGAAGVAIVEGGLGSRGLVAVEPGLREPTGPTLRDSAGAGTILVGGIRPDASLPPGLGWRIWLSYDAGQVAGEHVVRLIAHRFPAA